MVEAPSIPNFQLPTSKQPAEMWHGVHHQLDVWKLGVGDWQFQYWNKMAIQGTTATAT